MSVLVSWDAALRKPVPWTLPSHSRVCATLVTCPKSTNETWQSQFSDRHETPLRPCVRTRCSVVSHSQFTPPDTTSWVMSGGQCELAISLCRFAFFVSSHCNLYASVFYVLGLAQEKNKTMKRRLRNTAWSRTMNDVHTHTHTHRMLFCMEMRWLLRNVCVDHARRLLTNDKQATNIYLPTRNTYTTPSGRLFRLLSTTVTAYVLPRTLHTACTGTAPVASGDNEPVYGVVVSSRFSCRRDRHARGIRGLWTISRAMQRTVMMRLMHGRTHTRVRARTCFEHVFLFITIYTVKKLSTYLRIFCGEFF